MTVEVHGPLGTFNAVPFVEVTVVIHPGFGNGIGWTMASVSGFVVFTVSPRHTKMPSSKPISTMNGLREGEELTGLLRCCRSIKEQCSSGNSRQIIHITNGQLSYWVRPLITNVVNNTFWGKSEDMTRRMLDPKRARLLLISRKCKIGEAQLL